MLWLTKLEACCHYPVTAQQEKHYPHSTSDILFHDLHLQACWTGSFKKSFSNLYEDRNTQTVKKTHNKSQLFRKNGKKNMDFGKPIYTFL